MLKLVEIKNRYDEINKIVFNGTLIPCPLFIGRSRLTYGHFDNHGITISRFTKRADLDVILAHEMVHQYQDAVLLYDDGDDWHDETFFTQREKIFALLDVWIEIEHC
jgi:hypothetical protein